MTLYLVRHGKAGDRSRWPGDDTERPLSKSGRAQADGIAARLALAGIARVLSSPARRCRETVEPLARRIGVALETEPDLAEGTPTATVLRTVEQAAGAVPVAMCSHGDVIGDLLTHWQRHGVHLDGDGLAKGSVWVVEFTAGAAIRASYLPPPT